MNVNVLGRYDANSLCKLYLKIIGPVTPVIVFAPIDTYENHVRSPMQEHPCCPLLLISEFWESL